VVSVNLKLTDWVKSKVYSKLEVLAAFAVDVKLPLFWPVNVFVVPFMLFWINVLEVIVEFEVASENIITGFEISAKFIEASPFPSSQFRIPSLSLSMSLLSIIPSLSKSSGQILTGISIDSNCNPEQLIAPINL